MILGSVVLAGGKSTRMGRPKEMLPFLSSTLLGRTVETLLQCTFPVVVVARDAAQELPPLPVESDLIFDSKPGAGPLASLRDGLAFLQGKCDAAWVTSCDMPFAEPRVINWLAAMLGDHDVVIPRIDGKLQTLAAIYRVRLLDRASALLGAGADSLQALVADTSAHIVPDADVDAFDPRRRFLRNVNTPEDYEAAVREAGSAAAAKGNSSHGR